jgi:hypothetical protein
MNSNANAQARLASIVKRNNNRIAARKAANNNRKKNAAAISAARKAEYNKRIKNASNARAAANQQRANKLQVVRNRQADLMRIRAMNNAAVVAFFTGNYKNNNGQLRRTRVAQMLFNGRIPNKGVAQAYLNRYNKWNRGRPSIAARMRAAGNGSVRATQAKQALGRFFTTAPRLARLAAYRPFARSTNVARRATA